MKVAEVDEDVFVGKITWKSYIDFFTVGSSFSMLAVVVISSLIAQIMRNGSDWWMAYW